MDGLHIRHSARRCCGLLLGLLLALGPVAQSLAAAQGLCGRAPVSEASPEAVEASATAAGMQWTCPVQESAAVVRALPSERPDGPGNGSGGPALDDEERSHHTPSQRTGMDPVCPLISPVLAALRPVVLQI